MSNCSNASNSQLKAMQARLDRIDDDLIAHYAGVSQLVAGLAANPLTSGSVALSLKTYNFSSVGQKLMKKLMGLIPGYDSFKSLQHIEAAALIDNMGSQVAQQATRTVDTMVSEVQAVATQHADAVLAQGVAAANLARGIAQQVSQADRVALEAALRTTDASVDVLTSQLNGINQAAASLTQFIKCITDVASCKTSSSVIQ